MGGPYITILRVYVHMISRMRILKGALNDAQKTTDQTVVVNKYGMACLKLCSKACRANFSPAVKGDLGSIS